MQLKRKAQLKKVKKIEELNKELNE